MSSQYKRRKQREEGHNLLNIFYFLYYKNFDIRKFKCVDFKNVY